MKKEIHVRRRCTRVLLAVLNDQFYLPNKTQNEEKLAILCTYTFAIDPISYVFRYYCFGGHKHEYMGKYTKRRIPTRHKADLRK